MARLPVPGADDGTWGDILNDYLSAGHNADGTHSLSSSDISEGSRLYFTTARADARIAAADITDLGNVSTAGVIPGQLLGYNGTAWVPVSAAGGGDFLADGSVPATGSFNLGGFNITNLADPAGAQHAATQNYVDTQISGLSVPADTDDLPEGTSNLYYTNARFDTQLATKDTDNLSEGSTNLYFSSAEQTKLAGIEAGATADQTSGEIKTAYELNANTNAFTDAEQTKLAGIEAGAAADQTGAEIVSSIDTQLGSSTWQAGGVTDHGALTGLSDDDHSQYHTDARADTWLATKDTDDIAEGVANLYFTNARFDTQFATKDTDDLAVGTSNLYFTNALADARIAAADIEDLNNVIISAPSNGQVLKYNGANWINDTDNTGGAGSTDLSILNRTGTTLDVASSSGLDATVPSASGTEAGLLIAADKSKLDGIEAGATADQVASEVPVTPAGNLGSTDVQAALTELQGDIDGIGSGTTNLSYTAATRTVASDTGTDAVLTEVVAAGDSGLMTGTDKSKLDGIEAGATADQNATEVAFTPSGDIAAANVQSAVVEVRDDTDTKLAGKSNTGHTHSTAIDDLSDVTISTPSDGQVLKYSSGTWINDTDATGAGATNLSYTAATRTVASDTGTDAVLTEVVAAGDSGLMTGTDKSKLDGIEAGATADQTGAEIVSSIDTQLGGSTWQAGGQSNTASNQGAAGVGLFIQKTVADLEFKNINAGSTKISITDDTGNDEVDIDVVESNLNPANFSTNPLARANHTGTQTASTISDFSTAADARIAAASVNALNDVTISTPSDGQVLKYSSGVWINDTDATGGGSLPSGAQADVLRYDGTDWYASRDVFNVLDYGADNTGASDTAAEIQAAIDAAEADDGGVVYLPAGNYRIDSSLIVEDVGVHIKGAGHSGWGESGNIGAGAGMTGVNVGATIITSNSALTQMLLLENAAGTNDWRGTIVEDIHFVDMSTNHDQVDCAIKITEQHGSILRNVAVTALLKAGATAFILDPNLAASGSAVQYTQFISCRTSQVTNGIQLVENCPDTELFGCYIYGCSPSATAPISGSIGLNLKSASVRMFGGAVQFFDTHVYIDGSAGDTTNNGKHNRFIGVAIEAPVAWSTPGVTGYQFSGSQCDDNIIDAGDFANIGDMGTAIIIDTDVQNTIIQNCEVGTTLNNITDNGSGTMLIGMPKLIVTISSGSLTLTGVHRTIVQTGGTQTLTLPAVATAVGREYKFAGRTGGSSFTVAPQASEQIDGNTAGTGVSVTQYGSLDLICDGVRWLTV